MIHPQKQTAQTPSLANNPVWATPLGTRFKDPLHGILHRYGIYLPLIPIHPRHWHLRQPRDYRKHSTSAARARQFMRHFSNETVWEST